MIKKTRRSTSSKDYRLKEYLESLNDPALTPDDVKEIDEAGSQLHYRKFVSVQTVSLSDSAEAVWIRGVLNHYQYNLMAVFVILLARREMSNK